MLTNLVINAIEAQKDNRKIWISSSDKGDFAEIIVGNAGEPISPEKMENIFYLSNS